MGADILTTIGTGITIVAIVLPAILYLSNRIDRQSERIDKNYIDLSERIQHIAREQSEMKGKLYLIITGLHVVPAHSPTDGTDSHSKAA